MMSTAALVRDNYIIKCAKKIRLETIKKRTHKSGNVLTSGLDSQCITQSKMNYETER